jgi:hypothetical protein
MDVFVARYLVKHRGSSDIALGYELVDWGFVSR